MKRPPERPQKGKPIPHDWFGNFYDYVRSLEVRGDLATTTVSRDRTGTVVRAPFATSDRGGSGVGANWRPVLVRITIDNNDGSYNGRQQSIDSSLDTQIKDGSSDTLTFDSGNSGHLYEVNGRAGVPVNTVVVAYRLPDGDTDEHLWFFNATTDQYGFEGNENGVGTDITTGGDGTVGAWVEITAGSSSPYSWKMKDPNGTTDASPAVTGSSNLYEINGESIEVGKVVWAWFDGTNYRCEYGGVDGFWAEITDSSSPYSWKKKDRDATTDASPSVTGSNNLYEVNGRDGIPTGSIVWIWPDGTNYRTEFHGADSGTREVMLDGTSSSAYTDTWDRANQGTDRGVDQQFMTRMVYDSSTQELFYFVRDKYHDANGHLTNYTTETRKLAFVGAESDNTTPYKNCDTDAVVARFLTSDIPAHEYCWVHNGSAFVKAYRDTVSAGAATSPVPCTVLESSDPGACGSLDFSAFDDAFSDSSLDTCKWTNTSDGGASITETTSLEMDAPNGADARIRSECPFGSDDFSFEIDFANLSTTVVSSGSISFFIYVVIGGTGYQVGVFDDDPGPTGEYVFDGTTSNIYGSLSTSGSIKVERVGTSLKCYHGGTLNQTITISGSLSELSVRVAPSGTSSGNWDISDATHTGG